MDILAVGVIVDDEELLHIAIKGLPKEFNAFRSAIRTRSTQLSFDELSTLLNAEEESLNDGVEAEGTSTSIIEEEEVAEAQLVSFLNLIISTTSSKVNPV
nr:hypothetical protein CFP56_65335 [Quercus suber]